MSARPNPNAPSLNTTSIQDPTIRRNFQVLLAYFQAQGQLDGFGFLEQVFTQAQANVRIAHTLGVIPTDVLLTQLTGAGSVTFNFGLFDAQFLDITVTGACRVRFFFGVQGGNAPSVNAAATDSQTYNPGG